jgi:hypothetical protein
MPPTRVLGFFEATYWTLVLRDPRPGLPSRSSLRDYRKEKKPPSLKLQHDNLLHLHLLLAPAGEARGGNKRVTFPK